ncbi:MAG: DUF2232 domain-containing protein [Gemmatimonadaceae bacterium]
MSEQGEAPAVSETIAPAPAERGWGKILLAFVAFLLVPLYPELQAILPIKDTMMLFVPVVAACALVGWWAGGNAFHAIAWTGISILLLGPSGTAPTPFSSLARGWSLLLAGAFGLVCLFGNRRPLFSRALIALGITFCLATLMTVLGPMTASRASQTVSEELARRDKGWTEMLDSVITAHPKEWTQLTTNVPQFAEIRTEWPKELANFSDFGATVFPSLLALESLAAIALGWATYHRLGRTRLGAPMRPLREFRFNDQLVWGLIVGLTIVLLPTLSTVSAFGKNLLVFFGVLYAMRGLGVLSWFMAPGRFGVTLTIGVLMLFAPILNGIAAIGFVMLGVASLALGLGDTWADWRGRARPAA